MRRPRRQSFNAIWFDSSYPTWTEALKAAGLGLKFQCHLVRLKLSHSAPCNYHILGGLQSRFGTSRKIPHWKAWHIFFDLAQIAENTEDHIWLFCCFQADGVSCSLAMVCAF